jgi:hypothetical protein
MAQTLKSKIKKLSEIYSITAIIETAEELKIEKTDQALWDAMSTEEKTKWFYDQCEKYNLTWSQHTNQISIDQLPCVGKHSGHRAYFCVFLPHKTDNFRGADDNAWHLEIGGAYIGRENGGIWATSPGLKGKERQIAQVMELNKAGM